MQLIDTHCHLTMDPLMGDVPALLERSRAAEVTGWITVATHLADTRRAIDLAAQHEGMHATAGIHPHDAKDASSAALEELKGLARSKEVVAIGETGLDYHYNFSQPAEQRSGFVAQLEIAQELDLPVVIHSREAFDETMEVLDHHGGDLRGVVFHCFGGSVPQARRVLDKGYHISFTGVVTFKNAATTRETARFVPLERLMVETDCPYMSPEPVRRQRPNEPALMVHTARFLAELKGVDLERFARATTATALKFFRPSGS